MRHRLIFLALFLVSFSLSEVLTTLAQKETGKVFSTPTPVPIQVEQVDSLEIRSAYDQVVKAQQAFENLLLKKQIKYKAPSGWFFNFDTSSFEPPKPQPPATEKKP